MSQWTDRLGILTMDEKMRWYEKDPEAYNNWLWRMARVESDEIFNDNGYIRPRHRYSEDPKEP